MAGIVKQIIGSFEDIGRDVVRETVKVPKDIAGKALESLGTTSQKGQTNIQQAPVKNSEQHSENSPLTQLDQAKDHKAKQAMAREALKYLAGNKQKQKEPSIWEKQQREDQHEKDEADRQKQALDKQLQSSPARRPRGDLYGLKAKKNAAEMSRNVRQD